MSMFSKRFTPKRIRRNIKMDKVSASDFLNYKFIYHCEQCSHYNHNTATCTIGYNAELHKKEEQMARYSIHGHMALCRFIEID